MTNHNLPPAAHPIADLARRLGERRRNARIRRGVTRLMDLDDAILHDIGVTRGEIGVASRLPLGCNAARELRRMSQRRRSAHM